MRQLRSLIERPSTDVPRPHPDDDVNRLVQSPLFDHEWYAGQAGLHGSRSEAAEHYLTRGGALGFTPHPLFDPRFFARRLDDLDGRDAFLVYLDDRKHFSARTHPLFDTRAYMKAHPGALRHPQGPIGHYCKVGAPSGAPPNQWYVPDPENQPGGLVDWLRERQDEWRARRSSVVQRWGRDWPQEEGARLSALYEGVVPERVTPEAPLVTIVVSVRDVRDRLDVVIDSVTSQTLTDWELILVVPRDGDGLADAIAVVEDDPRVRIVRAGSATVQRAWNLGLGVARGSYVTWMDGTGKWRADHLRHAVCVLNAERVGAVYDIVMRRTRAKKSPKTRRYSAVDATFERLTVLSHIDINALVVQRGLALQAGGFDESLPGSWAYDFVLKMSREHPPRLVPSVGVLKLPRRSSDPSTVIDARAADNAVLNRHLVDWAALEARPRRSGSVSVVIPTPDDWRLTAAAVESIVRAREGSAVDVEVIVVDNGSSPSVAAVLQSLPERHAGVKVVHSPINRGFALGNNIALEHAAGEFVVFLNNDTEVSPGWIEPLVEALADPEILGAQSLLVYPTGSIQSAGVVFPACGGVPHMLLQGFPVEDARGLENASFNALTGAALAMRMDDVVALRGFDAIFVNGMEDVDVGLRLRRTRRGRFTVRPDSVVVHHESRSPGRFRRSLRNRRLLLDRWGRDMPGDDVALWGRQGFDVVRYEIRSRTQDARLAIPQPVLVRSGVVSVLEPPPRLRWALKNPAPAGPQAERWGDTHFARRLAAALRSHGQQVVIDNRPEFERNTGQFDDVVLVLRGLAPYRPVYGQVSIAWIISHPEMLRQSEMAAYDLVLAASIPWAERMSRMWRIRIDPLLQATDPALFHPDRARPDTGHPVLFVGGSRRQTRPIVHHAVDIGLPLSVYGSEWKGRIPRRFIKGQYYPNEEVGAAYRAAGIVLNDHWEDMRRDGFLSNRLFDAAAAGARVITDDVAALGDLFGRSVQVVRNAEELRRIATAPDLDAMFGDDDERRKVAARIHAEHSFEARARQLIDAAVEVYSQLSDARRAYAP